MKKSLSSTHWGSDSVLNVTQTVPAAPSKTLLQAS